MAKLIKNPIKLIYIITLVAQRKAQTIASLHKAIKVIPSRPSVGGVTPATRRRDRAKGRRLVEQQNAGHSGIADHADGVDFHPHGAHEGGDEEEEADDELPWVD